MSSPLATIGTGIAVTFGFLLIAILLFITAAILQAGFHFIKRQHNEFNKETK